MAYRIDTATKMARWQLEYEAAHLKSIEAYNPRPTLRESVSLRVGDWWRSMFKRPTVVRELKLIRF